MPFVTSIRGNYRNPKKNADVSIQDIFEITGGDEIYTVGGYTIHTFTSVGASELNIKLKNGVPERAMALVGSSLTAEYLVVAGGGAGGSRHGGGGGAGGMVVSTAAILGTGSYPTFVGAGGAGITGDSQGNDGQQSTFSTVTANGGGGGASWQATTTGRAGGSAGGSSGPSTGPTAANQPASLPLSGTGFGFPGGNTTVWGNPVGLLRVGSGGGAGGAGRQANGFQGVDWGNTGGANAFISVGGDGRANSAPGISYFWAGGGGGAGWNETGGQGGQGGGGGGIGSPPGLGNTQGINAGTNSTNAVGATGGVGGNGGTNTGGGGGGGQQVPSTGGNGGPGIIVVRYLSS
jgi:hypothetical protein